MELNIANIFVVVLGALLLANAAEVVDQEGFYEQFVIIILT